MTGRPRIPADGRAATITTMATPSFYTANGLTFIPMVGGRVKVGSGPLTGWIFPDLGAAVAYARACTQVPEVVYTTFAGRDPW